MRGFFRLFSAFRCQAGSFDIAEREKIPETFLSFPKVLSILWFRKSVRGSRPRPRCGCCGAWVEPRGFPLPGGVRGRRRESWGRSKSVISVSKNRALKKVLLIVAGTPDQSHQVLYVLKIQILLCHLQARKKGVFSDSLKVKKRPCHVHEIHNQFTQCL